MEFARPEYLVTAAWLAEHLDDPDVRVLDVTAMLTGKLVNRAEEECFAASHIPGSLFFDVPSGKGVLSAQDAPLPWMWPTPDEVTASLAAVGVGPATRVVLVARTPRAGIDSGTMWCTRAWWTLHHYGVNCAILHGGLEGWEAAGHALTDEPSPVPAAEPFVPATGWESARATKDDVLNAVDGPTCLVGALPATSFDGTGTSYGPRSGHITGAVNVPYLSLVESETAGFKDAQAMHDHLSAAGLLGDGDIITYCGGAIAATVDAFALALFDKTNVSVYDASLMEWTTDDSLPMTNPSTD